MEEYQQMKNEIRRLHQVCQIKNDAIEQLLNAFIHVEGDKLGNKFRTGIITHCENMKKALNNAREVVE